MLDVLNKHFQNLLSLSKTQSGLIQTAFFIAYLLVAFPAAKLIRRVGYQRGILVGLVILAIGETVPALVDTDMQDRFRDRLRALCAAVRSRPEE